jgi:hypothetical protein
MRLQRSKKIFPVMKEPTPMKQSSSKRVVLSSLNSDAPHRFEEPKDFLTDKEREDVWYEIDNVPSGSIVNLKGRTLIDKVGHNVKINIIDGPLIIRSEIGTNVKIKAAPTAPDNPAHWFTKRGQLAAQIREEHALRTDATPFKKDVVWAALQKRGVYIFADEIGQGLDIASYGSVYFQDDVSVSDVRIISGGSVIMARMRAGERLNVNASFRNAHIKALLDIVLNRIQKDTKEGDFQYFAYRDVRIKMISFAHDGVIKAGQNIITGNMSNARSKLYARGNVVAETMSREATAYFYGQAKTSSGAEVRQPKFTKLDVQQIYKKRKLKR